MTAEDAGRAEACAQVTSFAKLAPASPHEHPPSDSAIRAAIAFLAALNLTATMLPFASATGRRSVQLEWEHGLYYLEIEFCAHGRIEGTPCQRT